MSNLGYEVSNDSETGLDDLASDQDDANACFAPQIKKPKHRDPMKAAPGCR